MLKVLIVDDHAIIRERIKQVLEDTMDVVVGGEADTGQKAVEMVRNERWDLVLLDITMPGASGLDALRQMKKEKPDLPVLMLSMHLEEEYAIQSIKAGVSGYLAKERVPQDLIEAIRTVTQGRKYLSESVAKLLKISCKSKMMESYLSFF